MHMGVPSQYRQVHWYGRGPHECYPDRQYGAPLRQYSVADVKEFHVPYIFPSAGTTSCFDIDASLIRSTYHEYSVVNTIPGMQVRMAADQTQDG